MLNVEVSWLSHQGDDVEAEGEGELEILHVGVSSYHQAAYLLWGDCLFREGKVGVAPGLYLHDDQFLPICGYNIQLQVAFVPVAVANGVAPAFEVGNSRLLTHLAQLIMPCHVISLFFPTGNHATFTLGRDGEGGNAFHSSGIQPTRQGRWAFHDGLTCNLLQGKAIEILLL